MITLKYRRIVPTVISIGEIYLLEEVIGGVPDVVRIELSDVRLAELVLCGRRLKIKNGACEIAFSDIPCGEAEVEVITNGFSHFATPFLKTASKILRMPADEASFAALKAAYLELEGRVCSIETKVSDIENGIRPHRLFDFN